MYLCSKFNFTLSICAVYFNNMLFTRDYRTVEGYLGVKVQKLISSKKSLPFLCKVLNSEDTGNKLPNNSFDGAIGQIEKNELDIYFKQEHPFVDSDYILPSVPLSQKEYLISHLISEKELTIEQERLMFFQSFDFKFLAIVLAVILIYHLLLFFLSIMLNKYPSDRSIKFKHQISKIGFVIFCWLITVLTACNFKTNKVIVDTSEIISEEDKVFSTWKNVAWLKGESDLLLAENAPENSFLGKLYRLKNNNPIQMIDRSITNDVIKIGVSNFLLMNDLTSHITANYFANEFILKFFVNQKSYYTTYNVIFRKKSKSIRWTYFDKFIITAVESGLFYKLRSDLLECKVINSKSKDKILYFDVDEYIDDNLKVDSINLNSLFFVFLIEFLIYILIVIAYLVKLTISKLIKIFFEKNIRGLSR